MKHRVLHTPSPRKDAICSGAVSPAPLRKLVVQHESCSYAGPGKARPTFCRHLGEGTHALATLAAPDCSSCVRSRLLNLTLQGLSAFYITLNLRSTIVPIPRSIMFLHHACLSRSAHSSLSFTFLTLLMCCAFIHWSCFLQEGICAHGSLHRHINEHMARGRTCAG